ncbi:MAG: global cell cycle regulator GcrA-like protein [Rhodospirillaceae bacterium]|nr:global cell cycle regulator GcrA-like protein [Rhodospirillaceae bacterium]
MRTDIWKPEQISQLTDLWDTGLPTSAIGKKMGITKNSVIGKARRMGLPARPSPIRMGGPSRRKRAPKKAIKIKKEIILRPKDIPLVPLIDLGNGCPWPYGDPQDDDFGFCGQQKDGKKAYCAEHNERAYLKPKKRSGRVTFALKPLTQD